MWLGVEIVGCHLYSMPHFLFWILKEVTPDLKGVGNDDFLKAFETSFSLKLCFISLNCYWLMPMSKLLEDTSFIMLSLFTQNHFWTVFFVLNYFCFTACTVTGNHLLQPLCSPGHQHSIWFSLEADFPQALHNFNLWSIYGLNNYIIKSCPFWVQWMCSILKFQLCFLLIYDIISRESNCFSATSSRTMQTVSFPISSLASSTIPNVVRN